MSGYTRQSTASIVPDAEVDAGPLNAEFNQLQAAFNGSSGHAHDGSTGNGPQINLTTSVTSLLPITNGGTGASSASGARTSLGLAIGTNVQAFNAKLSSISSLDGTLGILCQTSANGFNRRTLQGTANQITITNGTGEAGNPVIGLTSNVTISGTMTANIFSGNGSSLTSLNASNITSGTIPSARLPVLSQATWNAGSSTSIAAISPLQLSEAVNSTATNASNLTTGTVPSGRLSGNYSGITGVGNLTSGSISGNFGSININGSITVAQNFISDTTNAVLAAQGGGVYLRANGPSSSSNEARLTASGTFSAPVFSGSGAGLSNIPQSGVVNLTSSLNAKLSLSGGDMTGGLGFGSSLASSTTNLSRHIDLYGGAYGFNVTSSTLNIVTGNSVRFRTNNGTENFRIESNGNAVSRGAMFVGNGASYLDTDGNPVGSVWSDWGSNSAKSAINARIEARGQAYSNQAQNQVMPIIAAQATNAIGTYALLYYTGTATVNPGVAVSSAELRYASAGGSTSGAPSGTWRCMGYAIAGSGVQRTTLYVRVA